MYLTCPSCHLRVYRRPEDCSDERCPRCGENTTVSFRRERILRAALPVIDAFACDTVRHGTTTTLQVSGEVDVSSQERLHSAGVTAAEGCEYLVADLTATTFLSSSGVRALVEIRQVVDAGGGRMVTLVEDGGAAAKVIHLCGLSEHLGVVREPARSGALQARG
jgi:anti-anti-sigma factor